MEQMANWSETISSDEMDGYYEYLNQMSEDEVSDFIYESLITTDDNGVMVLERTFDKAIRLFQLKKERQLALKEFPKPSSIMDQKKKHAFIQKRKAFFKGATLEDYKTFNGLDESEKANSIETFSDFRLRKSTTGKTFNNIMSGELVQLVESKTIGNRCGVNRNRFYAGHLAMVANWPFNILLPFT